MILKFYDFLIFKDNTYFKLSSLQFSAQNYYLYAYLYNFFNLLKFFNLFSFFLTKKISIKKISIKKNKFLFNVKKSHRFVIRKNELFFRRIKLKSFKKFFLFETSTSNYPLKKQAPKHHLDYAISLYNNFFFLTGQLISPYNWALENKKNWFRTRMLENFIKRNFNNQISLTSKTFYKNTYFAHFSFFSKLKCKFTDFKYFLKICNLKTKITNEFAYFTTKPYNILNINRQNNFFTYAQLLVFHNFFKQYSKINQFSNKFLKPLKTELFSKPNTMLLYKELSSVSRVLYPLANQTAIPHLKIKNEKKKKRIFGIPFSLRLKFCFGKYKNKMSNFSLNATRFIFNKFFLSAKKFEKHSTFLILKTHTIFFAKVVAKDISASNYHLAAFFWALAIFFHKKLRFDKFFVTYSFFLWNTKNLFTSSRSEFSLRVLERYKNLLIIAPNFFKSKFDKMQKRSAIKSLHVFSTYKLPFFSSKYGVNFIFNVFGFLYLTARTLNSFLTDFYSYMMKKKHFSFAFKNELQKFILKRYLKTNLTLQTISSKSVRLESATTEAIGEFFYEKNILGFGATLFDLNSNISNYSHKNALHWKNQIIEFGDLENTNFSFFIKKIKFKPGYMSLWREARAVFKEILNLNFKYQHRLTKYLLKFNKIIKFNLFILTEMTLRNIVTRSRFFFDWNTSEFFINQGLFFVNGCSCYNYSTQLYVGDLVQMLVHAKYYILYKWLSSWNIRKKLKLKIKTKKKLNISNSDEDKTKTKVFPTWILFNRNLTDDSAKFLEIDFFTLSVFIIYEPLSWKDLNPYSAIWTRYSVANMYNWKYIT